MKHMFVTASAVLLLLFGLYSVSEAGTYASSLRTSNPDSVTAFDGSFTDGTGSLLWFTLNGPADTARVTIYKNGVFVKMLEKDSLATGDQCVAWDGKDSSGAVVGVGKYTFTVFTSDTGSADTTWKQVWQNSVYLGSGVGLSSRDIIVVNDPANPLFGDLLMTESSSYGYARILVARANGTKLSTFGEANYPQASPSGADPFYIEAGKNGKLYVSCNSLRRIDVYNYAGGRVGIIEDTVKIGLPRGFDTWGATDPPTLYIATGRAVVRRVPAGTVDTIFVVDTTGGVTGYTRDVAVDDSGYIYISFGNTSSSYAKIVRLSPAFAKIDTMTLVGNATHLAIFHGADGTSNADDILYARVPGGTGGIFKVDFAAKTATKLFTPTTSTSANHSIGVDMFGNIYYANPSAEWAQMWRPPSSAPTKYTTSGGAIDVIAATSKVMDNFEASAGHFGLSVTHSGSTVGVAASSTAGRDVSDGHLSTASMKLVLKDDPASKLDWGVRFLSGTGSVANNDSLGATGWVGYWVKTRTAPVNAMVSIGLDDPSDPTTKRAVPRPVINDGEWHLYQWNIADSTQWTAWVVTSGSPKIKGPKVTVDAVWFMAPDSSADWTLNFDDVSYNGQGMLGSDIGTGDVTGDGTVSALDASWMLQYAVGAKTFTTEQKKTGDVNISSNGLDVTAVDAAVTLAAVVGQVSLPHVGALPVTLVNSSDPLPEKPVSIGAVSGTPGQVVSIPVFVNANVAGIRAAQMKLIYDASALKIRSVSTTDLTSNFMLASNIQDGYATIAMASASGLTHGGQLITVEAEIVGSGKNLAVRLENILLNDNAISSVTSVEGTSAEVPSTFALEQNYPNPFNPSTTIEYRLPQRAFVDMKIYDITGREVATLVSSLQEPGTHQIVWNATDAYGVKVASGVYFYRITAGSFTQLKKMLLLK